MTRYVRSWAAAAAALAMFPAWALAQQGTITGHVVDAVSKEPVPSVQVTIVGTHRGAVTDAQGEYRIGSIEADRGHLVETVIRRGEKLRPHGCCKRARARVTLS